MNRRRISSSMLLLAALPALAAAGCLSGADLRTRAENGEPEAQYRLGVNYFEGGETYPRDDAQAVGWFRKAAEQGHPGGQFHLGFMTLTGKGVAQDPDFAARMVRKAAEQGHADAQYFLARLHDTGRGVPRDKAASFKWLRRAAEQGHSLAQFLLGFRYITGSGIEEDAQQGLAWGVKSARQGQLIAIVILGKLYAGDSGFTAKYQDYVTAYKYYDAALVVFLQLIEETRWLPAEKTRIKIEHDRNLIEIERNNLSARMTSAQIAEGKRQAREMLERMDPAQVAVAKRQFRMMYDYGMSD